MAYLEAQPKDFINPILSYYRSTIVKWEEEVPLIVNGQSQVGPTPP
jgi:hypothetical protein